MQIVGDVVRRGIVFDIQRWSIHDGPGIRTNVFLKGCTMKCSWCSNPESQERYPEIAYFKDKCIGCGRCVQNCPFNAVKLDNGVHTIDYEICKEHCYQGKDGQYDCILKCYAKAMEKLGKEYTVDEILKEVTRDERLYSTSGGGITVTGGEPLMQSDFLRDLLSKCKENNINTTIETCGNVAWDSFEKVLDYIDFIFIDIKHIDADVHKVYTGVDNRLILENCIKLSKCSIERGFKLVVRTPVIPQINDNEKDIEDIARFIKDNMPSVTVCQLLPYHRLGRGKYENIGKEYSLWELQVPTEEKMKKLREVVAGYGLHGTYE